MVLPNSVICALEATVARGEVPGVSRLAAVSTSAENNFLQELVVYVIDIVQFRHARNGSSIGRRVDGM